MYVYIISPKNITIPVNFACGQNMGCLSTKGNARQSFFIAIDIPIIFGFPWHGMDDQRPHESYSLLYISHDIPIVGEIKIPLNPCEPH